MSTTTNLALNEPAYNSTSPTWDQPLNYNSTILDQMFGNTTSVSVSTSGTPTYTLIAAPSATAAGSTSQAMRINLTGSLAANQTVLFPQNVAGMWVVTNSTSGAYTVTVGSNNGSNAAAGTTVAPPQGFSILLYSDGTNIKKADDGIINSVTALTLTGNLVVGGTSTFNGTSAFNATATLSGSASTLAAIIQNAAEPATITATSATGTINFDVLTQSVLYYTTNSSSNFTLNFRGNGSNTFNSILATGQALTCVFINTNGSTPYYASAFTIDGTSVTPKWQNLVAPSTGNASALDIYTFAIIKTASNTYTVLAGLVGYA